MIEIVYDERKDNNSGIDRERYELPKNIRQVGNAPGNYKIYIEDYVMTYLRKIAAPGNMTSRGAILLGKMYLQNNEKVLFVSGAVDAQNLEFDISMIKFNDSVWSSIYSEINKYFDDLIIVGWFLSRMGFSIDINEQLKNIHRENFPGDNKILFLMDSLECDEAIYYYDKGSLVREKGYYIYYVRNESMQNYIISRKNGELEKSKDSVLVKDRTVVESFREKEKVRARDRGGEAGGLIRTVASFGVVCAVALGALWYISPDTFGRLRDGIVNKNSGDDIQVFMNSSNGDERGKEDDKQGKTPASETKGRLDSESQVDEERQKQNRTQHAVRSETQSEAQSKGQSEDRSEVAPEDNAGDESSEGDLSQCYTEDAENIYIVEAGDTLVSIAIRMYGDQTKAEDIALANEMDIDTPIYEGQKIIIPSVH